MEDLYKELSNTNIDSERINYILSLGYTPNDIRYMIKRSSVFLTNSISSIKNKIDNLLNLGFTMKDVIKITRRCPQIFTLSTEKIKEKIKYILSLGFTMEEIINIAKFFPIICSFSIETIEDKIKYIMSFGYTLSNVRNMIKNYPSILSMSTENLHDKINFYKSINLMDIIINDTKQLMISLKVVYARYMFYKNIGINIDKNNYTLLFIKNKDFERKYNITKEELINKYCNSKISNNKDNSKRNLSFKYDRMLNYLISLGLT